LGSARKRTGLNPRIQQGVEAGGDRVRAVEIRAGDRIRTGDVQLGNAAVTGSIPLQARSYRSSSTLLSAQLSAAPQQPVSNDPGLARVIDAWPALPDPIKAAVLALVSSGPKP
jgi:hypothetical protein